MSEKTKIIAIYFLLEDPERELFGEVVSAKDLKSAGQEFAQQHPDRAVVAFAQARQGFSAQQAVDEFKKLVAPVAELLGLEPPPQPRIH